MEEGKGEDSQGGKTREGRGGLMLIGSKKEKPKITSIKRKERDHHGEVKKDDKRKEREESRKT